MRGVIPLFTLTAVFGSGCPAYLPTKHDSLGIIIAPRKSVSSKFVLANSAVIRELKLVSDKIKMTFHNDRPSSFLNHPVSDFRLMIVYHPFENGYHTQAKAKGLRGWFIASLLVVCVCICFCICICDYLPDKIHRKVLQQDGHGQPVSRPAVACWVWGQQSHCISATTTGEEEEEMINKILSILRILQFFFFCSCNK